MKNYIIVLLVLVTKLCFANMASPYGEGTKVSSVFSSRDIDILNEKIAVTIGQNLKTASYIIEYNIKTDTDGKQIPLLFYAVNYRSDFKVWVDGKVVELLNVPAKYTDVSNTPFRNFANALDFPFVTGQPRQVTVYWHAGSGGVYQLSDLKYFEAILKKGNHQVRVEYTANTWQYLGNWIKEYSFNYSLSPARFWRSFGGLQISLTCNNASGAITTNLDTATHSTSGNTLTWTFNKLPDDVFQITYIPKVSWLANIMLVLQPLGLTLILALLLIYLHIKYVKKARRLKPQAKYLAGVIVGSLLVPLALLIFFIWSFSIIDWVIGSEASRFHWYIGVALILYPIIMPLYWLIIWGIDHIIKKKTISIP